MRRKKAWITACSDPISTGRREEIELLKKALREEGTDAYMPAGFLEEGASPAEKADLLTECFRDPETDYIFDISGGDLANLILPYLDYRVIGGSRALFFGYSDLTAVINAMIAKTGRTAVNYQVRNLLYDHAGEQRRYFRECIAQNRISADGLDCRFLRGRSMRGRVLGGNLRCFLKLAGTEYWPDMNGSILLLEAMGGGPYRMMTAMAQLRQMGVFGQVSGILLGTFSEMEEKKCRPTIEEIVLEMIPEDIPVARTPYIGHGTDAGAIVLGREQFFGE